LNNTFSKNLLNANLLYIYIIMLVFTFYDSTMTPPTAYLI